VGPGENTGRAVPGVARVLAVPVNRARGKTALPGSARMLAVPVSRARGKTAPAGVARVLAAPVDRARDQAAPARVAPARVPDPKAQRFAFWFDYWRT
jgi:hypothetical protein